MENLMFKYGDLECKLVAKDSKIVAIDKDENIVRLPLVDCHCVEIAFEGMDYEFEYGVSANVEKVDNSTDIKEIVFYINGSSYWVDAVGNELVCEFENVENIADVEMIEIETSEVFYSLEMITEEDERNSVIDELAQLIDKLNLEQYKSESWDYYVFGENHTNSDDITDYSTEELREFISQLKNDKDVKTPIATHSICNTASVVIWDIVNGIDDYVVASINDGEIEECMICVDPDGDINFFEIGEYRVNLDDCIRVNTDIE